MKVWGGNMWLVTVWEGPGRHGDSIFLGVLTMSGVVLKTVIIIITIIIIITRMLSTSQCPGCSVPGGHVVWVWGGAPPPIREDAIYT